MKINSSLKNAGKASTEFEFVCRFLQKQTWQKCNVGVRQEIFSLDRRSREINYFKTKNTCALMPVVEENVRAYQGKVIIPIIIRTSDATAYF